MIEPTGRSVSVYVTYGDECLGIVGPFGVASPWWADVEPVIAHLRGTLAVPVVVLRLVDVDGGVSPRGGHVTYHAEALARPGPGLPEATCDGLGEPQPGRSAWATATGVRAALQWADDELTTLGRTPSDEAEQVKTWNLSALFRLPTITQPVWLKLTPGFAAPEPTVIDLIASVDSRFVPAVIASDLANRRMLLETVPGADCWDASTELIRATLTRWVAAQAALAAQPALAAQAHLAGVPDRRPQQLIAGLQQLLDGEAGRELDDAELAEARQLATRLPDLIDELDSCGLPLTLVHGDFHPGNWRADGGEVTLIDFADAYFGHPAFDGERLREFVDPGRRRAVVAAWCNAWMAQMPSSDPARAVAIARPLQALSGAVLYQMFLDHIEVSERRYHASDPVAGVRDAIMAARELI